jgi:hypothetical protein
VWNVSKRSVPSTRGDLQKSDQGTVCRDRSRLESRTLCRPGKRYAFLRHCDRSAGKNGEQRSPRIQTHRPSVSFARGVSGAALVAHCLRERDLGRICQAHTGAIVRGPCLCRGSQILVPKSLPHISTVRALRLHLGATNSFSRCWILSRSGDAVYPVPDSEGSKEASLGSVANRIEI